MNMYIYIIYLYFYVYIDYVYDGLDLGGLHFSSVKLEKMDMYRTNS